MNTNIAALEVIVAALQDNDYVTEVLKVVEGGQEVGYTIKFSKSGAVTIYHGQDGAEGAPGQDGLDGTNGKDGHTPVIGVRQDEDGVYYWTLDGEWLLNANDQKIPTTGKNGKPGENGADGAPGQDAVTPQLKIEEGWWYISYNGGESWTKLGKATGEDGQNGAPGQDGAQGVPGQDGTPGQDGADGKDGKDGDSFFQSIDTTSSQDYIIITLADGTQIKLPTWKAFEELQTTVNKLNTTLSALQAIIAAIQENDYVTGITPIIENGITTGYTIHFSKSGPVDIYHGKNGADGSDGKDGQDGTPGQDGKDGYCPQIGVKQDTDRNFYWTFDGEWLLDQENNKIPADGSYEGPDNDDYNWTLDGEWLEDENGNNIPTSGMNGADGDNGQNGKDGVSPKLKIVGGYWYISYDGGNTWEEEPLGPASGDIYNTIFDKVEYDGDYLYIYMKNGEFLTLKRQMDALSATLSIIDIRDKNVEFIGKILTPTEDLPFCRATIYYSNAEAFNIFSAESVYTDDIEYNNNFSIKLNGLEPGTKYHYCLYIIGKNEEYYGPVQEFETKSETDDSETDDSETETEPDVMSGLNYYENAGYIDVKTGQVTRPESDWIHSDFIPIDKLQDDPELNHCIGEFTGHAYVANIAFYKSADFGTFIIGKSSAGRTKTVAELYELRESLKATDAKYIVISSDRTKDHLYANFK